MSTSQRPWTGDVVGEELLRHERELDGLRGETFLDRHELRLTDRVTIRAVVSPRLQLAVVE